MTLQYDVLDKTAVNPKHLGNIGHREGQIGEAGRERHLGMLECLTEARMDRNSR